MKSSSAYFVCVLLCIIFCSFSAIAQPSGGPYGPVQQTYELPRDAANIYYVAPDGNANAPGTLSEPTSLESAIEKVKTGDAIIMRGGVYRTGSLLLNQGITIQPYEDEQPILKGTLVADKWENLRNGLWKTSWSHLFPAKPADWWTREHFGKETPMHRFNNDMVFVDGRFLQSAGWEGELDANSYFIDYDAKTVFINFDPTGKLVEITAFDNALTRTTKDCHGKKSDKKGSIIRGITFTQYAYRAIEIEGTDPEGLSPESKHGKDVVGSTFENCTLSFCSRVAAYLRGDNLTMRHCLVSDTSTEGIFLLSSSDVLFEKNIFRRNNIEKITGYFPAAVKIFNQCYRVTCRDNLVMEQPNSNGIWYDVGNVDAVFIDNWVQDVGNIKNRVTTERFWPSDSGFFFEISKGAVVAGNVFVNCDQGIRVLNCNNVHVYNNTLVNSTVFFGRTNRTAVGDHFGWHPSTGPDVNDRDGHVFVNNLLTANENYKGPLLVFWQMPFLCEQLNKPMVDKLNNNVYVQRAETGFPRMIYWSPAPDDSNCQVFFDSPIALNKEYPQFEADSQNFVHYQGPLFKSPELKNFELLSDFPGSKIAAKLPAEIKKLLEPKKDKFIGAYPPIP
ncbi:MAG: right-handed parallel beta-helix repeat-containing protein [Sedimentisphaerales bacterium]